MAPELQAEVKAFMAWLRRNGADVVPTKGQWEVCRWIGPAGDGARIAFTNKRGEDIRSFNGQDAQRDYMNWREESGAPAEGEPEPETVPEAPPPTALTLQPPYTIESYTGADVHDQDGRWVATVHGTAGAKNKPLPAFAATCRLFEKAPVMLALLDDVYRLANTSLDADIAELINYIEGPTP